MNLSPMFASDLTTLSCNITIIYCVVENILVRLCFHLISLFFFSSLTIVGLFPSLLKLAHAFIFVHRRTFKLIGSVSELRRHPTVILH